MSIDITDTARTISYVAVAGQTDFVVPFAFYEPEDIDVYRNGDLIVLSGSPLTSNQYAVTQNVDGTGAIQLGAGAGAGDEIVIASDVPIERTTNFPLSGVFPIETLNRQLNEIVIMISDLASKSVTLPISFGGLEFTGSVDDYEGKVLGVSAGKIVPVSLPVEPDALPSFFTQPSISGNAVPESELTLVDGTVLNGVITSRLWLRDGDPIPGQYGQTYTLTSDDAGALIKAQVFASNAFGSTLGVSNIIGPIVVLPSFIHLPVISGVPQVGQTLSGTDGTFENGVVSNRQWFADGAVVGTGSTYQVALADVGKLIGFSVTLANDNGETTGGSLPVGPVEPQEITTLKYGSVRFPLANGDDINGVNGGLFLPNAQDLTEVSAAGDLPLLGQDGAVAVIWDVPRDIYRGVRRLPVLLGNDRLISATANRQFRLAYISEAENSGALAVDAGKFELVLRDNSSNEWNVLSAFWPETFSNNVMIIARRESDSLSLDLLDLADGTYLSGPSSSLPAGFEGIKLITNSLGIGAFRPAQFPQDAENGLFTNGVGYARGSCGGVLMIEDPGTQNEWQEFGEGADPLTKWPEAVRAWFPLTDSNGDIDLGFETNLVAPTAYSGNLTQAGTVSAGSTLRGQSETASLRAVNVPDPCVVGLDFQTGEGTIPVDLKIKGATAGTPVEARFIRKSDGLVAKNWHSVGTAIENGTISVVATIEAKGVFSLEFRIGSVEAYVNADIACGAAHLMNGQSQCDYTFNRDVNELDNLASTTRAVTFDTGVGERTYYMSLASIATAGGYTRLPATYYAPTYKTFSPGIVAAANRLAEGYDDNEPIIIIDVSVSGTTIADMLDNGGSPNNRNMADIYAITAQLRGRDSQDRAIVTTWNQMWHSSGSVENYAQAFMPALLDGTTTTQCPVVDDYPRSGIAGGINPSFDFIEYEPNRIISNVASTVHDDRDEHLTRKNLREQEPNYDYTLGAPLDVHRLQGDTFTHPQDVGPDAAFGAKLAADAIAATALTALGLPNGYSGPVSPSAATIDVNDATRMVVSFTGPAGFALGTIDAGTVTGFEVNEDRTGFTPTISGQTVILVKDSGSWTAGDEVTLKTGGPGEYGGAISEADFVSGGLLNTSDDCQVRGTGVPISST